MPKLKPPLTTGIRMEATTAMMAIVYQILRLPTKS